MDVFENFCIFGILRYGFPIEISISELLGHFDFWPLCNGGHNAFPISLALWTLLRPVWGWGKFFGHDLIH